MNDKQKFGWLDVPTKCDECGSTHIVYSDNSIIYGKCYGDWPKVWFCMSCKSAVSCHPGTNYPMGKLASSETRKARSLTHKHFDPLFSKHRIMSRTSCYRWLASAMGLDFNDCHISHFTIEQCDEVIKLCKQKVKQHKKKPVTVTHSSGRKVCKPGHKRRTI